MNLWDTLSSIPTPEERKKFAGSLLPTPDQKDLISKVEFFTEYLFQNPTSSIQMILDLNGERHPDEVVEEELLQWIELQTDVDLMRFTNGLKRRYSDAGFVLNRQKVKEKLLDRLKKYARFFYKK